LASKYRDDFALPLVVVGGSNGKTTTKELVASVLRQKIATLWSEASFNNDIGVPLTLLRLEKTHQAAVLEAGTNHPGELAPLLKMIRPKYGVITCIGREHLEFFGDVAGVAREEGWLAELLPADGKLFVNGDDEGTGCVIERTRAAVVRVGFAANNEWRARGLRLDTQGVRFQVDGPKADFGVEPCGNRSGSGRMPTFENAAGAVGTRRRARARRLLQRKRGFGGGGAANAAGATLQRPAGGRAGGHG
jgi:UDP-N-acetylmuramoyl-tripeptide--D-alanyl-D-alanine ligase